METIYFIENRAYILKQTIYCKIGRTLTNVGDFSRGLYWKQSAFIEYIIWHANVALAFDTQNSFVHNSQEKSFLKNNRCLTVDSHIVPCKRQHWHSHIPTKPFSMTMVIKSLEFNSRVTKRWAQYESVSNASSAKRNERIVNDEFWLIFCTNVLLWKLIDRE